MKIIESWIPAIIASLGGFLVTLFMFFIAESMDRGLLNIQWPGIFFLVFGLTFLVAFTISDILADRDILSEFNGIMVEKLLVLSIIIAILSLATLDRETQEFEIQSINIKSPVEIGVDISGNSVCADKEGGNLSCGRYSSIQISTKNGETLKYSADRAKVEVIKKWEKEGKTIFASVLHTEWFWIGSERKVENIFIKKEYKNEK